MAKLGRRSKCTPSLISRARECLESGLSNQATAALCGVSEVTFYNWIKQAESGIGSPNIVKFAKTVKEAKAINARIMVDVVTQAALGGSWQAAAYILERRHGWKRDGLVEQPPANTEEIVDLSTDTGKKQIVKALRALPHDLLVEALKEAG